MNELNLAVIRLKWNDPDFNSLIELFWILLVSMTKSSFGEGNNNFQGYVVASQHFLVVLYRNRTGSCSDYVTKEITEIVN